MNLVEQLIERVSKESKRIAVIGDTMTDRYVRGRVVECQDGCPKFVEECCSEYPGGAGNAYRSLGNWNLLMSTLHGPGLFGNMQMDGPLKTRFLVGNKIVYRHDLDTMKANDGTRSGEFGAMREWQPHAVLISDYDKGFLTPDLIKSIASWCRAHEIPCVADCKRAPDVYAGCVLKANEDYGNRHQKWWEKCGKLVQTLGERSPVVRGNQYDSQECCIDLPSVKCVNHVGAGDCFAAHLTLALAYGFSLKDAAAIAHSAGRVYVQFPNNRPPMPAEIAADFATAL